MDKQRPLIVVDGTPILGATSELRYDPNATPVNGNLPLTAWFIARNGQEYKAASIQFERRKSGRSLILVNTQKDFDSESLDEALRAVAHWRHETRWLTK